LDAQISIASFLFTYAIGKTHLLKAKKCCSKGHFIPEIRHVPFLKRPNDNALTKTCKRLRMFFQIRKVFFPIGNL
jgi:hypothetical protein